MKYEWNHGKNQYQEYYDVVIGKDYLCVYANKWEPDRWLGSCNNKCIHNKTRNDRVRKKSGLSKSCGVDELKQDFLLTSSDPFYMMKKVEWCYTHNRVEISQ